MKTAKSILKALNKKGINLEGVSAFCYRSVQVYIEDENGDFDWDLTNDKKNEILNLGLGLTAHSTAGGFWNIKKSDKLNSCNLSYSNKMSKSHY